MLKLVQFPRHSQLTIKISNKGIGREVRGEIVLKCADCWYRKLGGYAPIFIHDSRRTFASSPRLTRTNLRDVSRIRILRA